MALKKAKEFNYKVIETLATLSNKDNEKLQLRVISYNNYKPKLDLHKWKEDIDNKEVMLRGLTLTDEEALTLKDALEDYFKRLNKEEV